MRIGSASRCCSGAAEKAEADYAKRPWAELIEKYRSGPPGMEPDGWGKLDELTNGGEMFIHHEDARRGRSAGNRGSWTPRPPRN